MIAVEMEVKPESRILLMMPLTHSAPLHLFLMAGVLVGATNVLTPIFTPDLFIDTIEQEKITHFFWSAGGLFINCTIFKIENSRFIFNEMVGLWGRPVIKT